MRRTMVRQGRRRLSGNSPNEKAPATFTSGHKKNSPPTEADGLSSLKLHPFPDGPP